MPVPAGIGHGFRSIGVSTLHLEATLAASILKRGQMVRKHRHDDGFVSPSYVKKAPLSVFIFVSFSQERRPSTHNLSPITACVDPYISLLDYSGFKLVALSNSKSIDWTAIDVAVQEMSGYWRALSPQIKNKALRDLDDSIERGVKQATKNKDAAYLAFGGQMLLDAVVFWRLRSRN